MPATHFTTRTGTLTNQHPLHLPAGPDAGKLCLLDFGLVAEIPSYDRQVMVSATIHLANRDWGALVDDFIALRFLPRDAGERPRANAPLRSNNAHHACKALQIHDRCASNQCCTQNVLDSAVITVITHHILVISPQTAA